MRTVLATLCVALAAASAVAAPKPRAVPQPASPQAAEPAPVALGPDEIVRRANATLNGLPSLTASFTQVNAEGRTATGRLYVQRTGGLRFDYDPPASTEIVSDGSSVVIRDRRLNTSDTYPVSQTPLAFLLRERIDLARDLKLTGAASTAQGAYVSFESSSTFAGTSRVAVLFDDSVGRLRGWRVVDAQGRHTVVTLTGIETSPIEDARTFDIRFQRKH